MDPSYNNSFGSQGSGADLGSGSFAANSQSGSTSSIISSGSGDIRLPSSSTPSPRRRGLIIAGIVLIVLAIIGLMVGIVVMNSGQNKTVPTQTAESSQKALDRYVGFYLNGNADENVDISDYSADNNFFVAAINDGSVESEYVALLLSLYEHFYGDFVPQVNDQVLINTLGADRDRISFLVKFYGGTYLEQSEMAQIIRGNGNVSALIESADLNGDNEYDQLLLNAMTSDYDLLSKYNEIGCISEDGINYDCVVENNNEETKQLATTFATNNGALVNAVNTQARQLYYNMYSYIQLFRTIMESNDVQEV